MNNDTKPSILDEVKESTLVEEKKPGFWVRHRFILLIIMTLVTSLVLVIISMTMYTLSGTAQLDLSRPDYTSVIGQVEDDTTEAFQATGQITLPVIDEFLVLFDEQAAKAEALDAFGGDPLDPALLEFRQSGGSTDNR